MKSEQWALICAYTAGVSYMVVAGCGSYQTSEDSLNGGGRNAVEVLQFPDPSEFDDTKMGIALTFSLDGARPHQQLVVAEFPTGEFENSLTSIRQCEHFDYGDDDGDFTLSGSEKIFSYPSWTVPAIVHRRGFSEGQYDRYVSLWIGEDAESNEVRLRSFVYEVRLENDMLSVRRLWDPAERLTPASMEKYRYQPVRKAE